jgi:AcrR family transcriptional regulator
MYESPVEDRLQRAALTLFAQDGFDGTSVRAITGAAGANLGAVTYYFGSKRALYETVFEGEILPFREAVVEIGRGPGTPLERLEHIVRTFFQYLHEHPALPRLILQEIATAADLPEGPRRALVSNHGTIAAVIAEGQREGSIREGDPRLMALSIGSQPIMLALMRAVLARAVDIDQSDSGTRADLTDSVVAFVIAGLRRAS